MQALLSGRVFGRSSAHSLARLALARLVVAIAWLGIAAGCSGSERTESSGPRLVVLYAPCTVQLGFLSPYHAGVRFTPRIDAFAEESVVFRRHNTESGQSGTDFASIFTGTQASRHGVYCHPKKIDESIYQISEAFAEAGYETHYWSGHGMASWNLGYAQGVPRERAYPRRPDWVNPFAVHDAEFSEILNRLKQDPHYKAFVQISFTVTHSPYHLNMPSEHFAEFLARFPKVSRGLTEEDVRKFVALYDDHKTRLALQWNFPQAIQDLALSEEDLHKLAGVLELLYAAKMNLLDGYFGMLLDAIEQQGLTDQSLIAFTADHGESFYRENSLFQWTHGGDLTPEVLGVPWIVRWKGLSGGSYEQVTRSIDVFPTLAGLAGVPLRASEPIEGIDLSAALLGKQAPPNLIAFSHTTTIEGNQVETHRDNLLGVFFPRPDPELLWVRAREGDRVYKHRRVDGTQWRYEVFDLSADPRETQNLYDPDDPDHQRMMAELARYKAALVEGYGRSTAQELESDDSLERLKELGYAAEE